MDDGIWENATMTEKGKKRAPPIKFHEINNDIKEMTRIITTI